jgi:hypothetical protein
MATGDLLVFQKQREPQPVITMAAPPDNSVVLSCSGTEMIKIAKDGFYVRGIKLEQDDKEIKEVYNAFKEWLTWSTLNR